MRSSSFSGRTSGLDGQASLSNQETTVNYIPEPRVSSRFFYQSGEGNKERCRPRRQVMLEGDCVFPNPSRGRPISSTPIPGNGSCFYDPGFKWLSLVLRLSHIRQLGSRNKNLSLKTGDLLLALEPQLRKRGRGCGGWVGPSGWA